MKTKKIEKKSQEQKPLFMKTLSIISFAISIIVIVLSFLQIFGIWDKAINIFEPLLGVLMLIQTIENWKTNKKVAYISLFVTIVIFIIAIIVL